jgi:hypothetical protein
LQLNYGFLLLHILTIKSTKKTKHINRIYLFTLLIETHLFHPKQREKNDSMKFISIRIIYQLFGWLDFLSWSTAGYPQLISNFRRKRLIIFFNNFFHFYQFYVFIFFIDFYHQFNLIHGSVLASSGFSPLPILILKRVLWG